jgi:hypothetical protein
VILVRLILAVYMTVWLALSVVGTSGEVVLPNVIMGPLNLGWKWVIYLTNWYEFVTFISCVNRGIEDLVDHGRSEKCWPVATVYGRDVLSMVACSLSFPASACPDGLPFAAPCFLPGQR